MLECAKALKKKGDTIAEIRFFDEINANASGGTLDTVFHALGSRSASVAITITSCGVG